MPKRIYNIRQPIGVSYPQHTGRLKEVLSASGFSANKKVALLGDSTLDNEIWVEREIEPIRKTHTVPHQIAVSLAENSDDHSYEIANFSVDGATTRDLVDGSRLNRVVSDVDHPNKPVHQVKAAAAWGADIAVLSVGGNNYREALGDTLRTNLSLFEIVFRSPISQDRKDRLKKEFDIVKATLLREYKQIIDQLMEINDLERIVLVSQYYPAISNFAPYLIYTGFSRLAAAHNQGKSAFATIEDTMNDLYRDLTIYAKEQAASYNKTLVFADATSSLNPLGGHHECQIEPNVSGSKIMGRLIANAISVSATANNPLLVRLDQAPSVLEPAAFQVKKISEFIRENRYRHVGLLFSSTTAMHQRFFYAYDCVMGKQFDAEYRGYIALGLLDITIAPIIAFYLWQVAINEHTPVLFRALFGMVAAPILLAKMVCGLVLLLILAVPIYVYHRQVYHIQSDPIPAKDNLENDRSIHQLAYLIAIERSDNQQKIEALLKNILSPGELISKPIHHLIDATGQTFETSMSVFAYAFWAGNIELCDLLKLHLNEDEYIKVLTECQKISEQGVTAIFQDKEIKYASCFDLNPLIAAFPAPTARKVDFSMLLKIGQEQKKVPINVAQLYQSWGQEHCAPMAWYDSDLGTTTCFYNTSNAISIDVKFDMTFYPSLDSLNHDLAAIKILQVKQIEGRQRLLSDLADRLSNRSLNM